jgi:hypothetical protein
MGDKHLFKGYLVIGILFTKTKYPKDMCFQMENNRLLTPVVR